jgi:glycogen operon protein
MLMQMKHYHPKLQFTHILPYGALIHDQGVQFVVFSRNASEVRLLLYDEVNDREPTEVIAFNPKHDRWGDVWSIFVPGIGPGQLYHFQCSGPYDPRRGLLFDPKARLIDPYAKALAGSFQPSTDGIIRPPKCIVVDDYFDWEEDRHIKRDISETVIYEMHVRGFTRHRSSGTKNPGTYLGIIEKIPYLKSLGVTALELMPVHDFLDQGTSGLPGGKLNYWGYDPLAFFAPHRGYAADQQPGAQVNEFKTMVKALHRAGIEVILDVVFNHTCEGNELGPTLSFKGLENGVYYMLESDKRFYKNYSGCGNTINGNHPIVREMIFHCLRHWVHNYHIDGFRFDLASILSRDRNGHLVPNPPLVEVIGEDPMLADTKIIAEAWDAAGAYQVGSFGDDRWAEWNGRFRDDIRGFWRGDGGTRGALATRLSGSADLYQHGGRPPCSSINFITSHDGFTINDLVSYREKHNLANGENNRDGDNHNLSENFGEEGSSNDPIIEKARTRQIKNLLSTLLLSQGVPMLLAGDEFRRTQQGNNNAYCQDNEVSWVDWSLVDRNAELVRFVRSLIEFRKSQPTVRRCHFLTGLANSSTGWADVSWFSSQGTAVDWHAHDQTMICLLAAPAEAEDSQGLGREVLLLFNANGTTCRFLIPTIAKSKQWRLFIDTSAEFPNDIFPMHDGPKLPSNGIHTLPSKSLAVYVADR